MRDGQSLRASRSSLSHGRREQAGSRGSGGNSRDSPENIMAEAAPITPKNGAYTGKSSEGVLIVAGFVICRGFGDWVGYECVFTGCRLSRGTSYVGAIFTLTHFAKLVATVKYGLPGHSGAGHVMSNERPGASGKAAAAAAADIVSRAAIGLQRRDYVRSSESRAASHLNCLTSPSPIGCTDAHSRLVLAHDL